MSFTREGGYTRKLRPAVAAAKSDRLEIRLYIRADPILAARRVLEVVGGGAPISFRRRGRRQLLGGAPARRGATPIGSL